MSEIVAIVEGQTEQTFVRDHLAAHLGGRGITIWAVLSGKTRRLGGARPWSSTRKDIVNTLKEGRFCTTMFDFYAMPKDWPGREDAGQHSWEYRGDHVEQEIREDIENAIGDAFNPTQFIPYVQVHEFEALLFCETSKLAEVAATLSDRPASYFQDKLEQIIEEQGDAEAINDSFEACPSRRIKNLVPGYRKRLHGPIVAGRIGLDKLRVACRHFGAWVEKLERTASGDAPQD